MNAVELIREKAKKNIKHIVLPEGSDARISEAAGLIRKEGLAEITVIGDEEKVRGICKDKGVDMSLFNVVNPAGSPLLDDFVQKYIEMRKSKKPVSEEDAVRTIKDELGFGAMMVRAGHADGMVAGAANATADVCRAAFRIIGASKDVKIGSSFSLMQLPTDEFGVHGALIYADTGVVPEPNAEELADIAIASAKTAQALLNTRPKVAMISFSTKGSAKHPLLDKVIKATEIAIRRAKEIGLDVDIDGEMQADAALIPAICESKAPGSPIKGHANVLVFPDLNVGNTCYKLTERLAHAAAYGPVLQGLAKPASDLSRGCSAEDIVGISAIVACQAV